MKNMALTGMARTFAFAAALAAAALAHAAPKPSTVVNLGGEYAYEINNRGDVAGYTRVPEPQGSFPPLYYHAVIWENGAMRDIGASLGNPPGKAFTSATAVNDSGTFVINGPDGGILTLKNGTLESLGFQGAAYGINNSGTIVGSRPTATGSTPFIYRHGVLQELGNLGGRNGQALSVNSHGTVVGSSQNANGDTRGFIYKDGGMVALGTFGGAISMASDINNRGTIVGSAQDSTGRFIAFMTDESGVLQPFLDLPGNQSAVAINQRGDIVGTVDGVGYLYRDGEVTMLQDPNWWFLIPTSINDRGQIVGTGNRRGGPFTGEAFLLTTR
jgi:probable HAF family extracellular repeat protein